MDNTTLTYNAPKGYKFPTKVYFEDIFDDIEYSNEILYWSLNIQRTRLRLYLWVGLSSIGKSKLDQFMDDVLIEI